MHVHNAYILYTYYMHGEARLNKYNKATLRLLEISLHLYIHPDC